jgi:uncharacterized protein (UPF0297 family)
VNKDFDETMMFDIPKENVKEPKEILDLVFAALKEKGYDPIDQIIGYILSGDPTYITSYNNARNIIRKIERDELLGDVY